MTQPLALPLAAAQVAAGPVHAHAIPSLSTQARAVEAPVAANAACSPHDLAEAARAVIDHCAAAAPAVIAAIKPMASHAATVAEDVASRSMPGILSAFLTDQLSRRREAEAIEEAKAKATEEAKAKATEEAKAADEGPIQL